MWPIIGFRFQIPSRSSPPDRPCLRLYHLFTSSVPLLPHHDGCSVALPCRRWITIVLKLTVVVREEPIHRRVVFLLQRRIFGGPAGDVRGFVATTIRQEPIHRRVVILLRRRICRSAEVVTCCRFVAMVFRRRYGRSGFRVSVGPGILLCLDHLCLDHLCVLRQRCQQW